MSISIGRCGGNPHAAYPHTIEAKVAAPGGRPHWEPAAECWGPSGVSVAAHATHPTYTAAILAAKHLDDLGPHIEYRIVPASPLHAAEATALEAWARAADAARIAAQRLAEANEALRVAEEQLRTTSVAATA